MPYRDSLIQEGQNEVAVLRQALQQEQQQLDIQAAKLKAACWDTTAVPGTVIAPVGPACLTLGLGELETTPDQIAVPAAQAVISVHNMQIKKALTADEQQLQEVRQLSHLMLCR